jgi:glycosyltransferase involved in cell wall biosynthesis
MRIALANWSNRLAGGVETYLGAIAPALGAAGHEVGLIHETDAPRSRDVIPLPAAASTWCVGQMGIEAALAALLRWKPDVLYLHALHREDLERRLVEAVPTLFFIHQYHGTCVSGTKTHSSPHVRHCTRCLGPACLVLYYPRRCGGLNPATMLSDYARQSHRLGTLRRCRLLLTHSEYMRAEYLRHGFADAVVRTAPFVVRARAAMPSHVLSSSPAGTPTSAIRIAFVSRLEPLKGGSILLRALPLVLERTGRDVELTVVGDGTERDALQRTAVAMQARHPRISVRFTGWLSSADVDACYASADVLAIPSLWPEPFGMAGLEAGRLGVPTAAFAAGGIPEWLRHGVNGYVAPADPPTASGLAHAIVQCVVDRLEHNRLRAAAVTAASRHTVEAHLPALLDALSATRAA